MVITDLKLTNVARILDFAWRLAAWPAGLVLKLHAELILRTSRVSLRGPGAGYAGPAVYVNWHRYLPFLIMHHGQFRRWLMVSPAAYMDTIAVYSRLAGLRVVRGASGDRGRVALQDLLQHLRQGESVFLAVDGPAGPPFKVKRGCEQLARAAGVPVIPVAYTSRRGKHHPKRWDHWLSVRPFDAIEVTYGEPLFLGEESEAEAVARVAAALQEVMP
jgi:lysophospholipid acyltransferase (LPLAT)-like uncharacterized protein